MENLALFLHFIGAFLLVSGTVVAAVAFECGRKRSVPNEIAAILGLARIGAMMVGVGLILAVACGIWLVNLGDWGFNSGWISAAFMLVFAATVTGAIGGQTPKRARLLASKLANEGGQVTDELRALLNDRRALVLNYASGLLMLALIVVMVWKPGAAGS